MFMLNLKSLFHTSAQHCRSRLSSNSSTTSPPPNTTTSNQNRTDYTADTSLLRSAIMALLLPNLRTKVLLLALRTAQSLSWTVPPSSHFSAGWLTTQTTISPTSSHPCTASSYSPGSRSDYKPLFISLLTGNPASLSL